MFQKIMVPVDLAHLDQLERALEAAAGLSRAWKVPVLYVGVTTETPSEVAHTPEEFDGKLQEFAMEQADKRHVAQASARSYASHDPTIDLDETLVRAAREGGADLIVMASHKPGAREHLFASNAGWLAAHSELSVMVVR